MSVKICGFCDHRFIAETKAATAGRKVIELPSVRPHPDCPVCSQRLRHLEARHESPCAADMLLGEACSCRDPMPTPTVVDAGGPHVPCAVDDPRGHPRAGDVWYGADMRLRTVDQVRAFSHRGRIRSWTAADPVPDGCGLRLRYCTDRSSRWVDWRLWMKWASTALLVFRSPTRQEIKHRWMLPTATERRLGLLSVEHAPPPERWRKPGTLRLRFAWGLAVVQGPYRKRDGSGLCAQFSVAATDCPESFSLQIPLIRQFYTISALPFLVSDDARDCRPSARREVVLLAHAVYKAHEWPKTDTPPTPPRVFDFPSVDHED